MTTIGSVTNQLSVNQISTNFSLMSPSYTFSTKFTDLSSNIQTLYLFSALTMTKFVVDKLNTLTCLFQYHLSPVLC